MLRTILSTLALASALALTPQGLQASQAKGSATRTSRSAAKPSVTGTININTASADELVTLPGIGAKTAERILDYRQKNGPFKKVEELMNVRGVGEKNFLKLKDHLTVGTMKAEPHGQAPQR